MLERGFHRVPRGTLAAVVTHLQMTQPPEPRPAAALRNARIARVTAPAPDWYRATFRAVGSDWLWFSRLSLDDDALTRIIHDPAVAVHVLELDGEEAGFFELDFRSAPGCELAFFGLRRAAIGTGAGRAMMNAALRTAWAAPIDRLVVHTCSFDHPAALRFYRRSGFAVTRREIEIAPDPRLSGLLPRSAAPHVPILE